jgi:hypothetical protein
MALFRDRWRQIVDTWIAAPDNSPEERSERSAILPNHRLFHRNDGRLVCPTCGLQPERVHHKSPGHRRPGTNDQKWPRVIT